MGVIVGVGVTDVGVAGVGFGDAVGTAARGDGADAERLGDRDGLEALGLSGDALRADDASSVGELTAAAVAVSEAGGAVDSEATAAGVLAATELAGVGFTVACLADVEHAATAARIASIAIPSVTPARRLRRGMPHADTPARPLRSELPSPATRRLEGDRYQTRTAAMTSGDLPSMQQLLQQASQMQQQLMQAQEDLARERVVGDAGGGLVSATVTGAGELVGLRIDPSVVDPEDTETLADLVLAAVRAATGRAAALQAAKLGPLTQGFGGLGQLGGLGELDDGGLGGLPGGLPGLGL